MATLLDVARRAGVSTATVSRALTDSGSAVTPQTRQRVLDAAEALGYQPNRLPGYLRARFVPTIGFVVSDIGNPFYTAIARGCEDVIGPRGYSITLSSTDEDHAREAKRLRDLAAERVAGVIVTPDGEPSAELHALINAGVAVVSLDRIPGVHVDLVGVDNEHASFEGVSHLIREGHRRIGIVAGPEMINAAKDREAGYRRALREARIAFDPSLLLRGDLREDGGYRRALEFFAQEHRPTAIFSINNLTTIGVLRAARNRGLRIPDDVSIVGFDDIPTGDLLTPPLTVVAQPTYFIGAKAAELLLRRIDAPDAPVTEAVLSCSLIVRGSTAPPKVQV